MTKNTKESKRQKSKKDASEDPFEVLGHNAAGVLKGHVEKIEKELELIEATRARIKAHKKDAKADGFDAKALDAVIKKRKIDPSVRLMHEEQVRKMEEALGMETLWGYANSKDVYSSSEEDADREAAA